MATVLLSIPLKRRDDHGGEKMWEQLLKLVSECLKAKIPTRPLRVVVTAHVARHMT